MSLQPNSPPLTFDPSYASAADVEASKMTFTPDMLPQESTPDAVGRILKSVSQGVKPRRLVDAGKENRTPAAGKGSNQSGALSPLTQGHVRRARKGEYPFNCSNSSFSSRSPLTPQRGQQNSVEVSRVGRKQLTKVISAGDSIFSPTETGSIEQLGVSPDIHESAIPTTPTANVTTPSANLTTPAANLTTPPHSFSWKKETVDKTPPFTPTNQSKLKLNNPADREEALNRLYSQVEKLPPVAASPSDVLAARIAQSIIGDGDTYLPEDANVLDELGVSGFLKRDKIARTPETTGYSSQISSVTSKVVRHAGGETNNKELSFTGALSDDTEDGIITVKGQTLNISSSSSASSPPPNALQLPQVTAENSPVSPSNAGGVRSRPSSSRSTTELYKEKSLIDYICKTPSAGRRIVNSVLDEEPLFIEDSPVGTTPRHDDLYALMPQDTFGSSLHNSSGFTPSLPPRTNSTVRQQAGPMSSTNCSDEAASKPNSLTLEELGLKFAALKGRQLLTE
ncbi:hypothetical protein EB796_022961 [Bugula neritina]|uniref:Uncharacterized protein n=1 Tax=Bugula neritina TaxID=10212 RepID=A0A7J7IXT3_BUGNE|nr:hypothetical protein EB796_022961 [Bugula neritina]